MGKIGAFAGSHALDALQKNAGESRPIKAGQDPFWVASTLAVFAAVLAFTCLPEVGQDTIDEEDVKFREYLAANGYDVTKLGLGTSSSEAIVQEKRVEA